jgi:hypothetical protein
MRDAHNPLRFLAFAPMLLLRRKESNMEREYWAEISAAISLVDLDFVDNPDFEHSTALVVGAHVWATLHDRPTSWACAGTSWDRRTRPPALPSQPTMSRRLRTEEFTQFMTALEGRLRHLPGAGKLFKRLDGKPLPVAAHSTDPDAGWGRGAGQKAKGYKLHAVWAGGAMPERWRVAPLDVSEQEMARRMRRDLDTPGYVAADKNYDANRLFDAAAARDNQLLCPRRYGEACGLGHRRHSPRRLRSKDLLEAPTRRLTRFGPTVMRHRTQVERDFGNCVSFGGGLQGLPAWVRRYRRVKNWVWAKLMVNAARIRINHRKSRSDE